MPAGLTLFVIGGVNLEEHCPYLYLIMEYTPKSHQMIQNVPDGTGSQQRKHRDTAEHVSVTPEALYCGVC